MREQIRFEVGEKYENMKGVFEVIAIRRDSMDIRWEDGEEISTPIALQQRIIERMRHEREMEKAQAKQQAKKAKTSVSKAGNPFTGMEASDFSETVSRTTWRGRGKLGGAVARAFKNKEFRFNSWAVQGKPEVHWLDIKRQKRQDLPLQAKFFARVEGDDLHYGMHVCSPDASFSGNCDWHALMAWLDKEDNDAWLKKQCASHELHICDLSTNGFEGILAVKNDTWEHGETAAKHGVIEALGTFLTAAGKSGPLDLRIETRMGKDAVIGEKQRIAGNLVTLFEGLMPLYAAMAAGNA
jgi:hypothetical protein